jgi:hypothetical protein
MSHTPGPRTAEEAACGDSEWRWLTMPYTVESDRCTIADVGGIGAEARHNAALIAAAPDLLAALRDMVTLWDRVHPGVILGKPTLHVARAAIAKAEGKDGAE